MSNYEAWTLGVRVAAAILSALIAVLAIWGDWIRYLLTPPRLVVRLRSEKGELVNQYGKKARYYHLVASNSRIWAPAKNVVVFLIQIDRPGPGDGWTRSFESGPIPLVWQYSAYYVGQSNIGRERHCDLGFIGESQDFVITTQFSPEGLDPKLKSRQRMRVHVVAVADNAKSQPLVLELAWDGVWNDGSDEMAKHFSIKPVSLRSPA